MIVQPDNLPDDQIDDWHQAVDFFHRAYRMQVQGDLASAIKNYRISIRHFPTAEAHTFLGWVYAHLHLYEQAIGECHKAIALDPDYGNPYNDLGAYLLELGRPVEAISWLEQAVATPRYDARVFAYFNLGRAYEQINNWLRAIDYYHEALRIKSDYRPARVAAHRLLSKLN